MNLRIAIALSLIAFSAPAVGRARNRRTEITVLPRIDDFVTGPGSP